MTAIARKRVTPKIATNPLRTGSNNRVLEDYFADLNRYLPVSTKEEQELFRRYRAGDKSAKTKIVQANLRFVIKVAQRYMSQGLPIEDLISEGNVGLIYAVDKFEPDKNFKFISYAVWWIRQSILKAISIQSRVVTIPLNQTQRILLISRAFDKLMQKGSRNPTTAEVAKETGLPESTVVMMLRVMSPASSLDSKIGDSEITIGDSLQTPEPDPLQEQLGKSLTDELLTAFGCLSASEREAVERYYGFREDCQYTLKEIGTRMGVSRERIRQKCESACKKMRAVVKSR